MGEKRAFSVGMAEKEGFEPPIPLRVCRISSAVLSTTQPLLQAASNVRKRKAIVVEIASRCRFARERSSRRGLLYSQLPALVNAPSCIFALSKAWLRPSAPGAGRGHCGTPHADPWPGAASGSSALRRALILTRLQPSTKDGTHPAWSLSAPLVFWTRRLTKRRPEPHPPGSRRFIEADRTAKGKKCSQSSKRAASSIASPPTMY